MENKILDCLNYIKNISKQKVTWERIFIYRKKNDDSVSEAEIQETIPTLISLNRLEERGIGAKSYFKLPSIVCNKVTEECGEIFEELAKEGGPF